MPNHTERIAKIKSVRLGWEGHGIFTCMLDLDYGGSGQGAGGYALDEPRDRVDGKFRRRVGTAYGMEFVIRVMRACGAGYWSEIEGRTVLALLEDGFVVGLAPLPTEPGERFVFADLKREFFDGA